MIEILRISATILMIQLKAQQGHAAERFGLSMHSPLCCLSLFTFAISRDDSVLSPSRLSLNLYTYRSHNLDQLRTPRDKSSIDVCHSSYSQFSEVSQRPLSYLTTNPALGLTGNDV